PGGTGDPWRPDLFLLLDPEHGARRGGADSAVRSRPVHSGVLRGAFGGGSRCPAVAVGVSQSYAALDSGVVGSFVSSLSSAVRLIFQADAVPGRGRPKRFRRAARTSLSWRRHHGTPAIAPPLG